MKKIVETTLTFTLILGLSGCSTKPRPADKTASQPSKTAQTENEARQDGSLSKTPDEEQLFEKVYFDFDRYDIRPDAVRALEKNAKVLRANPAIRIQIEGHCDERGTAEYNLSLGHNRGNAVRRYLMDLGIASERLSIVSYGKERPVAFGHNEAAWSKNRRAEFVILGR